MKIRNKSLIAFSHPLPTKFIIDTHGGIEDLLAIYFAHQIMKTMKTGQQIIGITCTAGKNTLQNAVKTALYVNHLLGTKLPVYKGNPQNMSMNKQYPKSCEEHIYSRIEEEFYRFVDYNQELHNVVKEESSVDFIIRSCFEHKQKLAIICLGPVTSVALAHRLEEVLNHINTIGLTGGQIMGIGDCSQGGVSANFRYDPVAASVLFDLRQGVACLQDKIFVNPIENCIKLNFKNILENCLIKSKLVAEIKDIFVKIVKESSKLGKFGSLLTILPFLAPKTIQGIYHVNGEIVTDSGKVDGLLAINWQKACDHPENYKNYFFVFSDSDNNAVFEIINASLTN